MFSWLSKLLTAKIQVTVIMPGASTPTCVPYVIRDESNLFQIKKSNTRFVKYTVADPTGERVYYYTEIHSGHGWSQVTGTWFADKDKAMDAHLKFLQLGSTGERKHSEVLWEGLGADEAETWVALQKSKDNFELSSGKCNV